MQKRTISKFPSLPNRATKNGMLPVNKSVKRWVLRSNWPVEQSEPLCPGSHPDVYHSSRGRGSSKPSEALPACCEEATSSPASLLQNNHRLQPQSLFSLHEHRTKSDHWLSFLKSFTEASPASVALCGPSFIKTPPTTVLLSNGSK